LLASKGNRYLEELVHCCLALVIHLAALKLPDSTMKPRTLLRVGLAWCGAAQAKLESAHLLLLPALGPLALSLSGSGCSPSAVKMSRAGLDLVHHGQVSQTELDLVLPGSTRSPTLPMLPHPLPLEILHAWLVDLRSHWQQSCRPPRRPLLLAMLLSSACWQTTCALLTLRAAPQGSHLPTFASYERHESPYIVKSNLHLPAPAAGLQLLCLPVVVEIYSLLLPVHSLISSLCFAVLEVETFIN
jgi:hypothetical protein